MLKIKILEIDKHRNETTFRPFLNARNLFRDVGIQFIFEGNDYDLTWIGQASYANKSYSFKEAIAYGKRFLEKEVHGDYVLFDGQDSASLIGSWNVFKDSKAKLLLKNSLYTDFNPHYLTWWNMGRMYWGLNVESFGDESPSISFGLEASDEELFNSKVKLAGCNWLSTITPQWFKYDSNKDIDVCAMFSYPAKENREFQLHTNQYYDNHREKCIAQLKKLSPTIKVKMLENGERVPIEQYYNIMSRSKIIIAPFGYGEIAPRDIEAAQFGAVLIKPDMSHINTTPNVYNSTTFVKCDWTYKDLNKNIESILSDFKEKQRYYVENMRREYTKEYAPEKLVMHTYNWLSNLEGFGTE